MKLPQLKAAFVIIFIIAGNLFAQGNLKGIVVDSLTNQPLVGANVYVIGTPLGNASNVDGEYRISNIPAGPVKLKVSYIGYQSKEFDLAIEDNKTLEFFIELAPEAIEGITVVVTGQALGQAAAINQQITSNTIINVVSEEKIQELPDANAAESVGRLPGVSITRSGGEASKITLRGLSDKYTNITIDGVKIPPTDIEGRGLDLSSVSQSSLAGIELYKAITSDKDGDAIAGSVNFVTKKAPGERELRAVLKGGYNDLMKSYEQYDFSLKYGDRFFDDILGVQVTGNLEDKIRSSERVDVGYDENVEKQTSFFINNFELELSDEHRTRHGLSLILDYSTPDDGVIKFNNSYNSTKRDYLTSSRDYPNGADSQTGGGVTYSYRDREQEIKTFTSALTGSNYLWNFNVKWGLSFAQSSSDFPYDYQMDFNESEGMRTAPQFYDHPERLIDYAYNNFNAAFLSEAYYRTQKNLDKDQSAFFDILKEYSITNDISGQLKFGGKYKSKVRTNANTVRYAPYYLGFWQPYERLADGSIKPKDLTGTYFDAFFKKYLANNQSKSLPLSDMLDDDPRSKKVYDEYLLNPLIQRDKLRQWYELNKNGIAQSGNENNLEYFNDKSFQANNYDIKETVTSYYLMNTLDIGQYLTFLAGVRVETENNTYKNKYSNRRFSGFPIPGVTTRDTSTTYTETVVLPNFHLNFRATDFMNIRLAAYKALARPDFTMRLNTYFAWRPAARGGNPQLYLGNPILKTAKAWNFEINTSFYGNKIGLISLSAFYKEIKDMYHWLNRINTSGNVLLESLGLDTESLHDGTYQLTVPYNSPEKTKVWGYEFEHQINFTFLPGLLKNLVLSYNVSFVKSETPIISAVTDTTYKDVNLGGIIIKIPEYTQRPITKKSRLESQPDLFGNISLGYDIGGFSARLSLFHQSEYNQSFNATGSGNRVVGAFTKLDLVVKQKIADYLSLQLNVNNLTNVKEELLLDNTVDNYKLLDNSEFYGLTAELGVRVDL